MPETLLGASGLRPAAATRVTLYTCPASTRAVIHVGWMNDGAATTIEITRAPGGAAHDTTQFIRGAAFNVNAIDGSEVKGITLNAGDVLRVMSASGNVTFWPSGIEVVTGVAAGVLTVREVDGAPTGTPSIIEFDQATGLTVSYPVGSTARVSATGGGSTVYRRWSWMFGG